MSVWGRIGFEMDVDGGCSTLGRYIKRLRLLKAVLSYLSTIPRI